MKKNKTWITIVLCANSEGTEGLKLFFIGRAEMPRCFRKKRGQHYGLYYRWNKKAWKTSLLFQELLVKFDDDMRKLQQKSLHILDNSSTHAVRILDLIIITVLFLRPRTTSHIQPMDSGIIAALKNGIDLSSWIWLLTSRAKATPISIKLISCKL